VSCGLDLAAPGCRSLTNKFALRPAPVRPACPVRLPQEMVSGCLTVAGAPRWSDAVFRDVGGGLRLRLGHRAAFPGRVGDLRRAS
jgi:hypothetical protein